MEKSWICDDCDRRFGDDEVEHRESDGWPICPICGLPLDCDDPDDETPDEEENAETEEEEAE